MIQGLEQKILIVDDDEIMRRMICKTLIHSGFQVIEANNGKEAIAKFREFYPDAILMDIQMPVMDGFTACIKIRELAAGQFIPILMVTGLHDLDSINKAYEVGATDFISKPINWGTLAYSIRNVLRTYENLQELQKREAQLLNAEQLAQLGIWEKDINSNMTFCSDVLSHILDIPKQDLVPYHEKILDIVHPDDKAELTKLMQNLVESAIPYTQEYRIVQKNGTIRYLQEKTDLKFNEKGQLTNIFGVILDITMLKKLNIKLSEKNVLLQDANQALNLLNRRLKRRITIFNRFVPREFLKILATKGEYIDLGVCSKREITILFADIRSFTLLAEKLSLERVFNFINAHLSNLGKIIRKHDGFIDKFVGDAVMALFINPDDAVRAAIEMLQHIENYNLEKNKDHIPYSIGIGINTGETMMGTIGEYHHIQTTVIGDTVNLAAHVESLTKVYAIPLLITGSTFSRLKDPSIYQCYFLDTVSVKQKKSAIDIFEVLAALPQTVRQNKIEIAETYQEALKYYHEKQYNKARSLFKACLQKNPENLIIKKYLELLE